MTETLLIWLLFRKSMVASVSVQFSTLPARLVIQPTSLCKRRRMECSTWLRRTKMLSKSPILRLLQERMRWRCGRLPMRSHLLWLPVGVSRNLACFASVRKCTTNGTSQRQFGSGSRTRFWGVGSSVWSSWHSRFVGSVWDPMEVGYWVHQSCGMSRGTGCRKSLCSLSRVDARGLLRKSFRGCFARSLRIGCQPWLGCCRYTLVHLYSSAEEYWGSLCGTYFTIVLKGWTCMRTGLIIQTKLWSYNTWSKEDFSQTYTWGFVRASEYAVVWRYVSFYQIQFIEVCRWCQWFWWS